MAGRPLKRARERGEAPPRVDLAAERAPSLRDKGFDSESARKAVEKKVELAKYRREQAHQSYVEEIQADARDIVAIQRKILSLAFRAEPLTKDERADLKLAGDTADKMLDRLIGKATQVVAKETEDESAIEKAKKWARAREGE